MKANILQLDKMRTKLQDKLEQMEWTLDERSDKWHDSDAAVLFDDKMSAIDSAIDSISESIDTLAEAFNLEDLV